MDTKQKSAKSVQAGIQTAQTRAQATKGATAVQETQARKAAVVTHDAIARRAYEIYRSRKPHEGTAAQDWARAEKELMAAAKRA
jgi:hypothetical protein